MLRALHTKFYKIILDIKEFKYLSEMMLEKMQVSLEVHELRLKLRNSEKVSKQALQAKILIKMKESSSKNNKVKRKCKKKLNSDVNACKDSRSQGETS